MTEEPRSAETLQALLDEKNAQIQRLDQRILDLLDLIEELAKPPFARRARHGDAIDTQTSVHPRTRQQILVFLGGCAVAVFAVLVIAPLIGEIFG